MIDPFYRTVKGFEVLVEKEWCSLGKCKSLGPRAEGAGLKAATAGADNQTRNQDTSSV